ncbi:unnamed protein product [Lupinus luteus]|uniref:Uncharacterized protein n=1 Tax=Lupinus luteus TaxID=3873 RepID=A0AAV1XR65_LUPLU
MKSIEISIQTCSGMGRGWSSPAGANVEYLFLWQISHPSTYALISDFIPSQNKKLAILLNVLKCPE